jgi:hypothetical protein
MSGTRTTAAAREAAREVAVSELVGILAAIVVLLKAVTASGTLMGFADAADALERRFTALTAPPPPPHGEP